MLELPLSLDSSALHGFVEVRLLEGALQLQDTTHENDHWENVFPILMFERVLSTLR